MAALAFALGSCASPREECAAHRLLVLAAMPSELAPLLERATIGAQESVDGHVFRSGELGGLPVVLGQTWIGMENAAAATRAALARFEVTGVVVSGVAGSQLRIGDVAVPESWSEPDGRVWPAERRWLALAKRLERPGHVEIERCTEAPAGAPADPLCLPHVPAVVVGGVGQSGDSFGGRAYPCNPTGGDVFGCDVTPGMARSRPADAPRVEGTTAPVEEELPYVKDMETAAIARETRARGLPFLAFRAASDGKGDPLELREPCAQFFVYHRLAARNAANAATAFLTRLSAPDWCEEAG
jgi:nucleoside phosphorylase